MSRFTRNSLLAVVLVAAVVDAGDTYVGADRARPYTLTVAMSGYSPVSYLDQNKAEPGSPRFAAKHDGLTYFFTSARQRRAFRDNPERYLPAYGGYCAYGCAVKAKVVVDPRNFKIVNGRTHLFFKNAKVDTLELWNKGSESELTARADRYWATQGVSRAYLGARYLPASGVALDGYSPVSYFTRGRAEKGDARYAVEHQGVTYYVASKGQAKLFKKNPDRYVPQYGGWCAFGMAVRDKFPVDPTSFKVVDDKLYMFLKNTSVDARMLWNKGSERELMKKASTHWNKVSG